MENIIFNELKVRGFNVDVGVVALNKTNEKGHGIRKQLEIDFVCNKGSKRENGAMGSEKRVRNGSGRNIRTAWNRCSF